MAVASQTPAEYLKRHEQFLEKQSLLLAIGGDLHHENFALIIIKVMESLGMNHLQKAITDMGDLQRSQADAQGDLTSLSSLLSFIEGSVTKGGAGTGTNLIGKTAKTSANGLPSNFWNDTNKEQLGASMKSLFQLFFANGNTSLPTAAELNIEIDGFKIFGDGHGSAPASIKSALFNYIKQVLVPMSVFGNGVDSNVSSLSHVSIAVVYAINKLQQSMQGTNPNLVLKKIEKEGYKGLLGYYNPANDNTVSTGLSALYSKLNSPMPSLASVGSTGIRGADGLLPPAGSSLLSLLELTAKRSATSSGIDWKTWASGAASEKNWGYIAGYYDVLAAQYYDQNQPGTAANGQVGHGSLLAESYSAVSNGQSLFATQTTKNNAELQQYSSQLTSFDQIGQNIASAEAKFQDFVVQGSKS